MSKQENGRRTVGTLLGLHAQTSLHPGSGTALGTVDLPVQRERHTQWPNIAGSALKGILRDACRDKIAQQKDLEQLNRYDGQLVGTIADPKDRRSKADATMRLNELFGPPTVGSGEFAGALSVTDARLLAFPVRSLKGVFAWVTCPAVLDRLLRDAELAGQSLGWKVPSVSDNNAITASQCPCLADGDNIVLEEFPFTKVKESNCDVIGRWISDNLLPADPVFQATRDRFQQHLIILSDDDFTHFARHATEVLARVGLDYDTKTVKEGALFYQEFLPPETLFYSVVLANAARGKNGSRTASALLTDLVTLIGFQGDQLTILQIGGDETTGKGFCAARLWKGPSNGQAPAPAQTKES